MPPEASWAVRWGSSLMTTSLIPLSSAEVDEILDILFGLTARGITVIMIEHIMRAIMRFSERVLCIMVGKLLAMGPPDEIVRDP